MEGAGSKRTVEEMRSHLSQPTCPSQTGRVRTACPTQMAPRNDGRRAQRSRAPRSRPRRAPRGAGALTQTQKQGRRADRPSVGSPVRHRCFPPSAVCVPLGSHVRRYGLTRLPGTKDNPSAQSPCPLVAPFAPCSRTVVARRFSGAATHFWLQVPWLLPGGREPSSVALVTVFRVRTSPSPRVSPHRGSGSGSQCP